MNHLLQLQGNANPPLRVPYLVLDEHRHLCHQTEMLDPVKLLEFHQNLEWRQLASVYQAALYFGTLSRLRGLMNSPFEIEDFIVHGDSPLVDSGHLPNILQFWEQSLNLEAKDDSDAAYDVLWRLFKHLDLGLQYMARVTSHVTTLAREANPMHDTAFIDAELVFLSIFVLVEWTVQTAQILYPKFSLAQVMGGQDPLAKFEITLLDQRFKAAGWLPEEVNNLRKLPKYAGVRFSLEVVASSLVRQRNQPQINQSTTASDGPSTDRSQQVIHVDGCPGCKTIRMADLEQGLPADRAAALGVARVVSFKMRDDSVVEANVGLSHQLKSGTKDLRDADIHRPQSLFRLQHFQSPHTDEIRPYIPNDTADETVTSGPQILRRNLFRRLVRRMKSTRGPSRTKIETKVETTVRAPRPNEEQIGDALPYIAISHVWSQGLGNAQDNALPSCQALHVQSLCDELVLPDHRPVPFWMDTLCIPLDPILRGAAIQNMRRVYQDAALVLVIDTTLTTASTAVSPLEKALRIMFSPWNTRLWTFQEAVLARHLHFCYGRHSYGLFDLWKQLSVSDGESHHQAKDMLKDMLVAYTFKHLRQMESVTQRVKRPIERKRIAMPGEEELRKHLAGDDQNLRRWAKFALASHTGIFQPSWYAPIKRAQTEQERERNMTTNLLRALSGGGGDFFHGLRDSVTTDWADAIVEVARYLRVRDTTVAGDEALCIANILDLDIAPLLLRTGDSQRLKTILLRVGAMNPDLMFAYAELYDERGVGSVPTSLLAPNNIQGFHISKSAKLTTDGMTAAFGGLGFSCTVDSLGETGRDLILQADTHIIGPEGQSEEAEHPPGSCSSATAQQASYTPGNMATQALYFFNSENWSPAIKRAIERRATANKSFPIQPDKQHNTSGTTHFAFLRRNSDRGVQSGGQFMLVVLDDQSSSSPWPAATQASGSLSQVDGSPPTLVPQILTCWRLAHVTLASGGAVGTDFLREILAADEASKVDVCDLPREQSWCIL